MIQTPAYSYIKDHYADRVANRSQVPLINHIHEGIEVLTMIGASDDAKDAFCLHPLVQSDSDLAANHNWLFNVDPSIMSSRAIILALEYRNIANQYLSFRAIDNISEIVLSPLEEVNHMLIADKVQNYKDFIIYHSGTHSRSRELHHYFCNWLKRLNAVEIFETYFGLKQKYEKHRSTNV